MAIKIANFAVKTLPLFTDAEAKSLGIDELDIPWVRIAPASQADQADRQGMLAMQYNKYGRPLHAYLHQREIVLTFAGSNMVAAVPKLTEDGDYMYELDENENTIPVFEQLEFPNNGGGNAAANELASMISRLPPEIIACWSRRVREVNPQWGSDFRL